MKPIVERKQPTPLGGLLAQYRTANQSVFLRIKSLVELEMVRQEDVLSRSTATRVLLPFDDHNWKSLLPMIREISEEGREKTSFRCKDLWVGGASIVVAPPVPVIRARHRVDGVIHRDTIREEGSGMYSFLLCIDDVTKENGPIKIWKKSLRCECNEKCPG